MEDRMSNQDFLDGVGDNTRTTASGVIPEGFYPCRVSVAKFEPSAQKGTPGLTLNVVVTDGPFAGSEMSERDAVLWLSAKANPERSGAAASALGRFKHMTHAITGKYPDVAALDGIGFTAPNTDDNRLKAVAFWETVNNLPADDKITFWSEFIRLDLWHGNVVVNIGLEDETYTTQDGEQRTVSRNRIVNLFSLADKRYGIKYCKDVQFGLQEEARTIMAAG